MMIAIRNCSSYDFDLELEQRRLSDTEMQYIAIVNSQAGKHERTGVGKFVSDSELLGNTMATFRALNNCGLLRPNFRANNQKQLRQVAGQALQELVHTLELGRLTSRRRCEAEGVLMEHLNRIASAAVLTATNATNSDAVLNLFDTSAWMYDANGLLRDSFTETDHWLAWYPGLENGDQTVDAVMKTMPAATASEIPWIVRMLENPESWLRFRGAVALEDHDVMHVLLGRGLQDQDEAFVIGFAMGTAKKVNWLQSRVLRWVVSHLYPEPYRIPKFLLPAFDLGVQCGLRTGSKNLYKKPIHDLIHQPLKEARARCELDVDVLREFYRLEQKAIPLTIASVRLP